MKTIKYKDFDMHFYDCLRDVADNKERYKIELEDGKAVMILDFDDYQELLMQIQE